MTKDRYTERLSAYLDDDVSVDERREIAAHVETCAPCRSVLADLRTVVAEARALEPGEPPHDLWPGIAARIEAERDVVLPLAVTPPRTRRFSFTVPQLAAASLALVMASGASAWMLGRAVATPAVATAPADDAPPAASDAMTGTQTEVVAAQPDVAASQQDIAAAQPGIPTAQPSVQPRPGTAAQPVSTSAVTPVDDSTAMQVAQLERMLVDGETALDPATIAVLRRNLLIIDAALAEASAALETDPANPYLSRHYQNTMLKKLELLRQAGSIGRGIS